MQFQVPQFIEVEDTIFGPLTFRQFIYVAGGIGLAILAWRFLPFLLAAPVMGATVGLGIALAFVEYNSRPLRVVIEDAFYYLLGAKLYLWDNARKSQKSASKQIADPIKMDRAAGIPTLSDSKLHELAWSLDIKENVGRAGSQNTNTE